MSTPTLPATRLTDARAALHAALALALTDCGWPAERAHRHAPGEPDTPFGYVDVPVLGAAGGGGLMATFPVWLVADGGDAQQRDQLDDAMAYGWQRLSGVRIGSVPGRETRAIVLSAAPETVELGARALAVVFRVQCPLALRTLCTPQIVPET